jgi:hypothetical protein
VESTIGRVEGSQIFELHKNISKSFQKPTSNLDFFARLKKKLLSNNSLSKLPIFPHGKIDLVA